MFGDNDFGKRFPGILPPQKLTTKQKTKKWMQDCVDYVCRTSTSPIYFNNHPYRKKNMEENERLYEGYINEEDLTYITKPFKVKDGLPARLKEYNLVRPLVDSLHGEEVMRPMSFSVTRTSEEGMSQKQEMLRDQFIQYCQQAVLSNLSPEMAQQYQTALQEGSIQPPEAILKASSETYKDMAEHFCQVLVNSEVKKLDAKTHFMRGYMDLIKHGEEIYYVGEEYRQPNLRRVNPRTFCYEYSPDLFFIDDAAWCSERMIISYAELYDRYGDEIEEKDLNKILEAMQGTNTGVKQLGEVWAPQHINLTDQMDPNNPFGTSSTSIEVWKVHWKSFRKLLYVTINNPETNQPEEILVDDTYVPTGDEEDIREDWVMQVWQGHRIRGDIYFGIRPITCATDINDPTSVKLPYTGLVSHEKSIVEVLRPIQITYLSLWYRLDLLLSRDNGQVLLMDYTQIPKSKGIDVDRWAHMMKAMGVILVNPYENSWDIPGRDGSKPAGFQAFQSIDLSTAKSIGMYMELITKVEQMAQQIIGFNPQRMGQVGHRDLAGTTEQALQESYTTTAYLVYRHDKVKERCLRKLLNTALAIRWRDDDDYLAYIGDDGMAMFMNMPHTALESMDLYVVDSQEEARMLQTLQGLLQPAMQAGASLRDMAVILSSNNVRQVKLQLDDIERRKEEMMAQQQQQEQELKQAEMQQVEQDRQVNIDQKNADRQMKKYEIDSEERVKMEEIRVKAETAFGMGAEEQPPDPVEERKLQLEETKAERDYEIRQTEKDLERERMSQELYLSRMGMDEEWRAKLEEVKMEKEKLKLEKEALSVEDAREMAKLKAEKEMAQKELNAELDKLRLAHRLELDKMKEQLDLERVKMQDQLKAELAKIHAKADEDKKAQKAEITSKEKIEKAKIAAAKLKPKTPAKKK